MSFKLREGSLNHAYLTDEDIWRIFSSLMSAKSSKSATYKYVLFKSLIENLYNVNDHLELTYEQLAYSFAKMYWNMVAVNGITNHNSGKNARTAVIIMDYQQAHQVPPGWAFDRLAGETQLQIINKMKAAMKVNVFGALYGDTDARFYAFDHKAERLHFHPQVYKFLLNYQSLLVQLTNFHLGKMIEKLNSPLSAAMLLRIEDLSKRSSLKPFEEVLLSYVTKTCFYCQKPLQQGNRQTQVDHFIPWSFVQSDQIWNLVLSCGPCNNAKRDKLAKEDFLVKLIDRNEELLDKMEDGNLTGQFTAYKAEKLEMMYEYSMKNGFDEIWVPSP
ncbi:HNH endonuclease domain-containing protein [Alkalicoccus daliensis]|uniref:HNH endonuclease n=1 Tax=Alkalicoccus daliensis TaxID=745820 RepID=A0A1H0F3I4_9BACI|nr:HNH endonuclease domain-containing protein [Alkalicoccus daliensis]SDN89218.1 HNH endonuclease [Alkalicoccus daliensis]